MIPKLRFLALLLALTLAPGRAEESEHPVEMAPFVVEGSYTEISFRARFRYNIPGKPLKYLVITKAPASWLRQGAQLGDRLVAIDGAEIDGMSIMKLVKLIESRSDNPMKITLISSNGKDRREMDVLLKKGSGELVIHYP